jgi:predicted phage tail protein
MLKRIVLEGDMGQRFGSEFMLDVAKPSEAIHALSVMVPGLKNYLYQAGENGIEFEVLIDNDESIDVEAIQYPFDSCFVVTPVPVGSGATARIIAGVVLIAVAVIASVTGIGLPIAAIALMGASLLLSGIAQALTPTPQTPKESAKKEGKDSFLFSRAAGTSDQGIGVPLLYGEYLVSGMAILSSSIEIIEDLDAANDDE